MLEWLKRRFKTFDYFWDYIEAAHGSFNDIIWGVAVIGVAWAIPFTVYAIASQFHSFPSWANWLAVLAAVLVSGYYVWRADHVRLEKRICVGNLVPIEWTIAPGQVNAGHRARRYYFEVFSTSDGLTIESVSVQLSRLSPEVGNLNCLPVYLHLQHDNPIKSEDQLCSFDLNPGDIRNIDLVSAIEGDNRFSVVHVVHGANCLVPYDTCGNRLQVKVTGKHILPISAWFKVWRNETGFIECEMEK